MSTLQGRRVGLDLEHTDYLPGDYSLRPAGHDWPESPRQLYFRDPAGHIGRVVSHTITEEADGTITVSPSILDERGDGRSWHGFLERGVWRDA